VPAFRWLGTDLVKIVSDGQDFVDAVVGALAASHDRSAAPARRASAAEHSWDRRVELLARHLDLSVGALG
jgi:hypothetical protein